MVNETLQADHEAHVTAYRAAIEELNAERDRLIGFRHIMDLVEANLLAPRPSPITGEIIERIDGRNEAMRKAQLLQHTEDNDTYQDAKAARQECERNIRRLEGEREISHSYMSMTRALTRAEGHQDD